ncbi:hypothetical protein [Vibrio sp. DNB22_19_1]
MNDLLAEYENILSNIDYEKFDSKNDKYSGVFLPVAFDEYFDANKKIMVVGRETAGWNTENNKNTIRRIIDKDVNVVKEATERYRNHLLKNKQGDIVVKSRSRYKQFYFRIAKDLSLKPSALIYSNLFAWDYDRKSPMTRPYGEFEEVKRVSLQILATQIYYFKPDFIIFTAGISKIVDDAIKELFTKYFDGYQTESSSLIKKKFWEFDAAGAKCFRIAHPRATHGHDLYRELVLSKLGK